MNAGRVLVVVLVLASVVPAQAGGLGVLWHFDRMFTPAPEVFVLTVIQASGAMQHFRVYPAPRRPARRLLHRPGVPSTGQCGRVLGAGRVARGDYRAGRGGHLLVSARGAVCLSGPGDRRPPSTQTAAPRTADAPSRDGAATADHATAPAPARAGGAEPAAHRDPAGVTHTPTIAREWGSLTDLLAFQDAKAHNHGATRC